MKPAGWTKIRQTHPHLPRLHKDRIFLIIYIQTCAILNSNLLECKADVNGVFPVEQAARCSWTSGSWWEFWVVLRPTCTTVYCNWKSRSMYVFKTCYCINVRTNQSIKLQYELQREINNDQAEMWVQVDWKVIIIYLSSERSTGVSSLLATSQQGLYANQKLWHTLYNLLSLACN